MKTELNGKDRLPFHMGMIHPQRAEPACSNLYEIGGGVVVVAVHTVWKWQRHLTETVVENKIMGLVTVETSTATCQYMSLRNKQCDVLIAGL